MDPRLAPPGTSHNRAVRTPRGRFFRRRPEDVEPDPRGRVVLRRAKEVEETAHRRLAALDAQIGLRAAVPEHGRQGARVGRDRRVLAVRAPALDVEAGAVVPGGWGGPAPAPPP